jgi:trimeric autotransporter adhesin
MAQTAPGSARRTFVRLSLVLAVPAGAALAAAAVQAATNREARTPLEQKAFFRPELYVSSSHEALDDVLVHLPTRAAWEDFFRARGETARSTPLAVFIDPRSGAVSGFTGAFPIIPGDGVGNRLVAPPGAVTDEAAVTKAARQFVDAHRALLGIDVAQLGPARTTQVRPDLWQISIPQEVNGVRVRDARLAATISHGNLVTIGTEMWSNASISTAPGMKAGVALAAGFDYAGGRTPEDTILREPALEIVVFAPPEHQHGEGFGGPVGAGYGHRLVWTFEFQRAPEDARWEVMVDAHSGEVVSFLDKNQYQQAQVTGGVYPLTSTGICPNATQCGIMQSGWPMPFTDTGLASPNNFTNSSGVFNYTGGNVTTTLTGRFVDIVDTCGAVSQSSGTGNINLGGMNNQHDCTTGGGSAGNTPASRSAFYEVNRIAELARGWLPSNTWLQSRLTTNVNLNQTCNAFWNGTSINFFRSGGGCRNTGEIAGVFDHEWGHGLDDNDAAGALSNSSEAYADVAAIYRLQTSCVGHGFFQTVDDGCGTTADGTGFNVNEAQQGASHCATDCSGVRDADFQKHNPATPQTALGFVCGQCLTGPGPCGRQVHCSAAPSRQAAWDLAARDLQSAPFSLDSQSAFIVASKVFYQGSGNIGAWHACTCGSTASGCGSTNAYMQWLAADDDNGNLNDGTPHMTAIHAAFNRHGIACATPTPVNSGCSNGPTAAPSLTATPGNFSATLSWNTVAGATRYWVFRSDGHAGCNFGKTLVAEVTGTTYTDTQVANGRPYSYNVVAAGTSSDCYGRASNCVSVTPVPSVNPDFSLACSPSSLSVAQGASGTSTCTVSSQNGFANAVDLLCNGLPSGAACSFAPDPVTPPANGNAASALTLSVGGATPTGTYSIQVQGVSGSLTRNTSLSLTVTGTGGNPQIAVFDTVLQAPKCVTVGSSCETGTSLVLGRAGLGPEPNQPNTINDSCADGTSGTFHSDESNDALKVSTTDGTSFAAGKTVRIDATVWAWTTPSQDHLDLYFAANATSPSWTFVATLTPTVVGAQTLSATYTLPAGALQAVRAQFRYQGSASPCTAGGFNDRDDLVFAVTSAPQTTVFSDDFETEKGWTRNAGGTDTATTGLWERGDPEATDSGGPKQLGTTVSGVNDLVTARLAGASAGVNDIDGGVTTIHSPAITLPATGSLTLSFSYYLAHGSNSASDDFFRARVVGTTNTVVFQSLGAASNRNGVWTTASASLNAFAGQTVRIVFEAADAGGASLVEAGVDNVTVVQQ